MRKQLTCYFFASLDNNDTLCRAQMRGFRDCWLWQVMGILQSNLNQLLRISGRRSLGHAQEAVEVLETMRITMRNEMRWFKCRGSSQHLWESLAASLSIKPAILHSYCRHKVRQADYPGISARERPYSARNLCHRS